jgi:hypothetical protein
MNYFHENIKERRTGNEIVNERKEIMHENKSIPK